MGMDGWDDVVPVSSLGCLLGRDFLDAVGAVLNFANRSLECIFLGAGMQRLDQMTAGHFMVPLLPIRWPRPHAGGADPPKVTTLLRLPRKTYHSLRNGHGTHARTQLCKSGLRANVSCQTSFRNGRSRNFCAGRVAK